MKGTVDERSAVLRARVKDHLARTGGRRGKEAEARDDFMHAVIRYGRSKDMRLWKDSGGHSVFEVGMQSLLTLLEEKAVYNPNLKRWNTGRNVHWVLDLWEGTLNHLNSEPLFQNREQPEDTLRPEEEIDREDDAIRISQPRAKGLSMKIVEAYLSHDEDAILELASQVAELEARVARRV